MLFRIQNSLSVAHPGPSWPLGRVTGSPRELGHRKASLASGKSRELAISGDWCWGAACACVGPMLRAGMVRAPAPRTSVNSRCTTSPVVSWTAGCPRYRACPANLHLRIGQIPLVREAVWNRHDAQGKRPHRIRGWQEVPLSLKIGVHPEREIGA
jgi:hypothetical protein